MDYDETVHDFISKLEYQIKKENREREYYDYDVDDLIEHYFVNQEYIDLRLDRLFDLSNLKSIYR